MGRRGPSPDYVKREKLAVLLRDGTSLSEAARLVGVNPVSYTHLDVYKRQRLYRTLKAVARARKPRRISPPISADRTDINLAGRTCEGRL